MLLRTSVTILALLASQMCPVEATNKSFQKAADPDSSFLLADTRSLLKLTCYNGGTFVNEKCECTERYEGEQCEIEPCLNNGKKGPDSKCHCPWGTAGERCEKITHCTDGNAKLVDGKCVCKKPWTGIFCNERMCHNGEYVGDKPTGYCRCDKGYTGPFCDAELICQHGFVSEENKCMCDPNWTGETCNRCAIDRSLVGDECKVIINEESLVAPQAATSEEAEFWSILVISSAIAVVVILIAVISVVLLKKKNAAPSKIDSTLGTDV